MGLKETIVRLAESFAAKKKQDTPEEKQAKELEKLALKKELYAQFERTVILEAIDKINAVPGVWVLRAYTNAGLIYKVRFSFFEKDVRILFTILHLEKDPTTMEVAYIFNVGSPKELRHIKQITIKDSADTIVDIFEQGIQICGPK